MKKYAENILTSIDHQATHSIRVCVCRLTFNMIEISPAVPSSYLWIFTISEAPKVK